MSKASDLESRLENALKSPSRGPRVPRTTTVERKVTYRLEFSADELRKRLRLPADATLSFGGTEFSQEFGETGKIVATFMVTR